MYPEYQNTGTAIPLNTLKAGDKYRCNGYASENTILAVMETYIKVRRADNWIINLAFSNPMYKQIVYIDKK